VANAGKCSCCIVIGAVGKAIAMSSINFTPCFMLLSCCLPPASFSATPLSPSFLLKPEGPFKQDAQLLLS
jgi:hypothetical protein